MEWARKRWIEVGSSEQAWTIERGRRGRVSCVPRIAGMTIPPIPPIPPIALVPLVGRVLPPTVERCFLEGREQPEHVQLGKFFLTCVLLAGGLVAHGLLARGLGPSSLPCSASLFNSSRFFGLRRLLCPSRFFGSSARLHTSCVFGVAGRLLLQVIAMSFEVLEREALRRHRPRHLQRVDVDRRDQPPSEEVAGDVPVVVVEQ